MIASRAIQTMCPSCHDRTGDVFYEQWNVPVTSNRIFLTREEAMACERGDIRLAFCHACGFISNIAFDPGFRADDSETTQAGSPKFREYSSTLARTWIKRHGLQGKTVLEIGCGRGEFLQAMVENGVAHAIGVDPVLVSGPAHSAAGDDRFNWIAGDYQADHLTDDVRALICRHTLEHIPDTATFLDAVRESIGDRDMPVLFEVPDILPILRSVAIHDIYYEHCAYFSAGSLARAFARAGFAVERVTRAYDGQYLLLEARPTSIPQGEPAEDDRPSTWQATAAFRLIHEQRSRAARKMFTDLAAEGRRIAFWGAGSKATAYLTTLQLDDEVQCVVDINPRKQGTFIPGTGHPVVAPADLVSYRPDVVVVMNEIYREEIAEILQDLGVDADLIGVGGHA